MYISSSFARSNAIQHNVRACTWAQLVYSTTSSKQVNRAGFADDIALYITSPFTSFNPLPGETVKQSLEGSASNKRRIKKDGNSARTREETKSSFVEVNFIN